MTEIYAYVLKYNNKVYAYTKKTLISNTKFMLPIKSKEVLDDKEYNFSSYILDNNIITGPKEEYGSYSVKYKNRDFLVRYVVIDLKLELKSLDPSSNNLFIPFYYLDKRKFSDISYPIIDSLYKELDLSDGIKKVLNIIYYDINVDFYEYIESTLIKLRDGKVASNIKNVDDFIKYLFKENKHKVIRKYHSDIEELARILWNKVFEIEK